MSIIIIESCATVTYYGEISVAHTSLHDHVTQIPQNTGCLVNCTLKLRLSPECVFKWIKCYLQFVPIIKHAAYAYNLMK